VVPTLRKSRSVGQPQLRQVQGLASPPFNLGSLLGLSPGTQCGDFLSCSLGPFAEMVGVNSFQEGIPPGCSPPFATPCGWPDYAAPPWETAPPPPPTPELPECGLVKESWDPGTKWSLCRYDCSDLGLGELCDKIPGSGCQLSVSASKLEPWPE